MTHFKPIIAEINGRKYVIGGRAWIPYDGPQSMEKAMRLYRIAEMQMKKRWVRHSKTEANVIYILVRNKEDQIICSCSGFKYHGYCWHRDDVLKEIKEAMK